MDRPYGDASARIEHGRPPRVDNTGDMEAHQRDYVRAVHKRVRRADAAVISRVLAIQLAWIVSLVCGAGVTLVQALDSETIDWLSAGDVAWISALLGFIVVVAQGAGRLVGRTSGVVHADDTMRRKLAVKSGSSRPARGRTGMPPIRSNCSPIARSASCSNTIARSRSTAPPSSRTGSDDDRATSQSCRIARASGSVRSLVRSASARASGSRGSGSTSSSFGRIRRGQ